MSYLWLGPRDVMAIDRVLNQTLPKGFEEAFQSALKKVLNKAMDFGSERMSIKRELINTAPTGLKTLGVAWSYAFEMRFVDVKMLSFGKEDGEFDNVRVLPVSLVVRDNLDEQTRLTDFMAGGK